MLIDVGEAGTWATKPRYSHRREETLLIYSNREEGFFFPIPRLNYIVRTPKPNICRCKAHTRTYGKKQLHVQSLRQQVGNIQAPEPLRDAHSTNTHSRSHEQVDSIVIQPVMASLNTSALMILIACQRARASTTQSSVLGLLDTASFGSVDGGHLTGGMDENLECKLERCIWESTADETYLSTPTSFNDLPTPLINNTGL